MENPLAVRLADPSALDRLLVGGKAAALVRLHAAGFAVPRCGMLTAHFFAPWIDAIASDADWHQIQANLADAAASDPARIDAGCAVLKTRASRLELDSAQRAALAHIAEGVGGDTFAVRSSSPEEDLAGASFAGLYESVLHVPRKDLPVAVRRCFASCFDARVLFYKAERNMHGAPRFAVIIQRQVESVASGVVFSLNPHNNDFDEAVINATTGLGDRLVAGETDPDQWVIDKVNGAMLEKRPRNRCGGDATACLDDEQAQAVAACASEVETLFGKPVDVEWAFADGVLYVLQARPITTYVPLPEEIRTVPGQPRMLYMDPSLGEGITMSGAVSPLSVDVFAKLFEWLGNHAFGHSFLGSTLR